MGWRHHTDERAIPACTFNLAVQVVDLPEVTRADQALHVTERRVVEQKVPHHEDQAPLLGEAHELLRITSYNVCYTKLLRFGVSVTLRQSM